MPGRGYYEILGLSKDASEQQIKQAYRQLALKYHPDKNPGDPQAEERFKEAAQAYSVLIDKDKRRRYDRVGPVGYDYRREASPFDPTVFRDFADILGDIFGFQDVQRERSPGQSPPGKAGNDLKFNIEIGFREAVSGATVPLKITRLEPCEVCDATGAKPGYPPVPCSRCGGRGRVLYPQGLFNVQTVCRQCSGTGTQIRVRCTRCAGEGRVRRNADLELHIPKGVESGTRLRLKGQGDAGPRGGPHGHLHIVVKVTDDAFFRRDRENIYSQAALTFSQAAMGTVLTVPSLEGDMRITVPPGTQSGTTLRFKGKGLQSLTHAKRGDYYVTLTVKTPGALTDEHKALFEQLAALEGTPAPPQRGTLMRRLRRAFGAR